MFDFVKNRRIIVGIIVGLFSIPFAFFGIDFYFRGGAGGDRVASVAGGAISSREFTEALQRRQQQLRRAMGGNADQNMLDSPEVRKSVLTQLIDERLLYAAALHSGMTISQSELREAIAEMPIFRENGGTGNFSTQLYQSVLRSEDMSEQGFEALMRRGIMLSQVQKAVIATSIVPAAVAERVYRLRAQQREVSQLAFAPNQFIAKVEVPPEALKAYYEANPARFTVPEQVRVRYLILTQAGIEKAVQVDPERVKEAFEARKAELEKPEERRARHILVAAAPGASPEQKVAARKKAEALLAQARKAPNDFAELAKKNSEDPGSAGEGGDLGFTSRGHMVKPFDDALFGMKAGEITGPVETQYGYHIIKLEAIKAPEAPKLEGVKAKIEEELRKVEAGRRFAEAAENFSNLVYEQPESLKPAADAFHLETQTSGWIARDGSGDNPLLANEKFVHALFSDEALKNGHNTEAVEVAPNVLVAAHVIEHKPATLRPFEEVRSEIVAQLTGERAIELAKREGEALLARLNKGEAAGQAWSQPQLVTRERQQGLSPDAARAVFRADISKLPAYVGASAADGRYIVYRIDRVIDVQTIDAEARKVVANQLEQMRGREMELTRLASLKQRSDIQIDRKVFEKGG